MSNAAKIFDFVPGESAWRSIDDVVMGGVSQSTFGIASGQGVFEGTVSLENNGGFASVRSQPEPHDLSGYDGLMLRVRTHGKHFKFRLRMTSAFDGVSYQAAVPDQGADWAVVRIPFSDFAPVWRGRPVPDAPKLDPAQIQTFGFLISDKQEGSFRLEIDWIAAYREADEDGPS